MNEVRWRLGRFDDLAIAYRHRGAPGDERVVQGREVGEVTRGWLVIRRRVGSASVGAGRRRTGPLGPTASIPWHRVLRIELDGHVLWERVPRQP